MRDVAADYVRVGCSHMALRNGRADGVKKKKNKTRIRNISILVALIIVAIVAFQFASDDEYAQTREDVLAKYLSYEDASTVTYDTYVSRFGKAYVDDKADKIVLKASDYSEADMEGLKEEGGILWTQDAGSVTYDFNVKINGEKDPNLVISISEKGGHVVFMNYNRTIEAESVTQERADEIGKKFLEEHDFPNMKETYYLKQDGIVTINYAYEQDGVTVYPDLIKLKIALDNGEVMGIETTGYLNSHEKRNIEEVQITKEQAKQSLNKELEIKSENLAIIPTQWKTEVLCWEFKGKVDETDFLVYINAKTGKEEDILVIVNTPNGTLTH